MADKHVRNPRVRYREYMRHSNPFKFRAARIAAKRQKRFHPVSCRELDAAPPVMGSELSFEKENEAMTYNSPVFLHETTGFVNQDVDTTGVQSECYSELDNATCSQKVKEEDELLYISDSDNEISFERFVKDMDDECLDSSSDCRSSDSDTESIPEQNETELNDQLYPGAAITSTMSTTLLLSFVMKHKLSRETFNDLLAVIEAHCPRPNNCKTTVKQQPDFLSQAKEGVNKHYFCKYCKAYYGKGIDARVSGNCSICGKVISNKSQEFFLEVPISNQLQKFFADPEFVQGLKYRFQRVKRADRNIEDVYDGQLYQSKCGKGGFLSQQHNISLKINTDGVAIFNSSQFGIWPLFMLINELPPTLRIERKYRIFGGLWFGEQKPFFSTFFKPFVETLCQAEVQGLDVVLPKGEKVKAKVMVLSGHFDLPARAGVLEQVSYVGHDSCSYCEEHGETVKTSTRGHAMTFPFRNTDSGHAKLRTAEEVRVHSFDALERNRTICGFKAPSPLLLLPNFDVVNGISIDSMHCVCLGVVKQLIATEYRNWLFYYSLPCMRGILNEEYHQHYALLVGAIVTLSGRTISPAQLEKARKCLAHFVEMIDVYYGARYLLMNQHMLLHLTESVRNHGPLWCNSLFVFEDWNGDIGNYFHGTQNIPSQIMTAVIIHQSLPELIDKMPSGNVKDMVLKFRGYTDRTNRTHLKDEFYAIGALWKSCFVNPPYEDDLLLSLGVECISEIKFFTRLQAGKAIFHSKQYKRATKRNSYTVAYRKESEMCYGQVEVYFVNFNEPMECGAVITPMGKSKEDVATSHEVLGKLVTHIVPLHQPRNEEYDIVDIDNIVDLCLHMKFLDCEVEYGAHFPNHLEKD